MVEHDSFTAVTRALNPNVKTHNVSTKLFAKGQTILTGMV